MDTETKEPSRAKGLLAKAISQTGVSAVALLALFVAAILNADLWIQLVVALAFVVGSYLIAQRVTHLISEPFGSPAEQELVTLATSQPSETEQRVAQLSKYWPAATLVLGIISAFLATSSQFNIGTALTVFSACLLLTNSQALALVIPLGFSRTIRLALSSGVVVRSRAAFEKIGRAHV